MANKKQETIEFVDDSEESKGTIEFVEDTKRQPIELSPAEKPRLLGGLLSGIPIVKELEEDLGKAQQQFFEENQSRLRSAREQKLVKDIGGSIVIGAAAGSVLRGLPLLSKMRVSQPLVASEASKIAAKSIRIQNVQRAIQRQAIEGALSVQAFDYNDIGDRVKASAIASVISPATVATFGAGSNLVSGTIRGIRKISSKLSGGLKPTISGGVRDPRMPSIKKVRESLAKVEKESSDITSAQKTQITAAEREAGVAISSAEEIAKAEREAARVATSAESKAVRAGLENTKRQINQSIDDLDIQLNDEANVVGETVQAKTTKFLSDNSKAYGRQLDSVSDEIAKSGRVTLKEGSNILETAMNDALAADAGAESTPIFQEMRRLFQEKYGPVASKAFNQASNLGQRGRAGSIQLSDLPPNMQQQVLQQSQTLRDQSTQIAFKELLTDLRGIWKQAYKGDRFSREGIPAANLQNAFGEFVSTLPGGELFSGLQSSYRPVISWMNKLASVTKPFKGPGFKKEAELLVRRVARGETDVARTDVELLNFVERGTEKFAKGIGSVSARARQMGENIKVLKSSMKEAELISEKRLFDIAEEGLLKISRINENSASAGRLIKSEAEKRTAMIMEEAARLESNLWKRARTLQNREAVIQTLNSKSALFKKLGFGLVKLVGGLASSYVVVKGGSELGNIIAEGR